MTQEKRRYTIGNNDDMRDLSKIANEIRVFSGCYREDEPVCMIKLQEKETGKSYRFDCFQGDVLTEYEDGSWSVIEKKPKQSRAMSALAARLS